jgi:uncharacterized protein with FMN-binding domain
MKKLFISIGIFIGLIAIMFGVIFLSLKQNMEEILTIPINEIDISSLEDGTYQGTYYFEDEIGATVDVVIANHQITSISFVEHKAGKGTIAEIIIDDIVSSQSVIVDDIAGATTSSHVIKLAVINALEVE